MRLSRNVDLPSSIKRILDGPIKGGTFWGLDGANDAIRIGDAVAFGDLAFMMKNGNVWMTDAFFTQGWNQVNSVNDLPKFTISYRDNYSRCSVDRIVAPFMPQFYFVPRNRKGKRFLSRATTRAFTKSCKFGG